MIFYFSGCGNSRFIAESIAKELNDKLIFIPEAKREKRFNYTLAENERVGFVFPIYSWMPPALVTDFVRKVHFDRHPDYVWVAVTCGDNGGYADRVFRQQLEDAGLPLHADFCFVMPNVYVNMAGMTIDSPEKAQRKIEEAQEHLPEVIQDIACRRVVAETHISPPSRVSLSLIVSSPPISSVPNSTPEEPPMLFTRQSPQAWNNS